MWYANKNGNTPSVDGIAKEMKDVSPTFKKLENVDIVTIGYKWVNFGEDSGRKATAVWALYGLKSVADDFRYILAD